MKTLEQLFDKNKILPTLVLEDITKTVDVVNVLYEAGIRMMSVRVLSQTSLRSIELIRKKMPEMAVGAAGTMDAAGFLNASLVGAQFIASPGITSELLTAARTRYNDAHFLPGAVLPSQIMEVITRGLDVVNLYPAEIFNGSLLIEEYKKSFPGVKFTVSGGITIENMEKYLVKPSIIAVGVGGIATNELLEANNLDEIRHRAKEVVDKAHQILNI